MACPPKPGTPLIGPSLPRREVTSSIGFIAFHSAVIKLPYKSNLDEKGLILAPSSRVEFSVEDIKAAGT